MTDLMNPYAQCPVEDADLLGDLYDNNSNSRDRADLKALQDASLAVYADPPGLHESVRFGQAPWQAFDVFRPASPPCGALVFVHGGRWQLNTSRETAFWAASCVAEGRIFIGLNFPQRSQAHLFEQTEAVRQGIEAALDFIRGVGGIGEPRVCLAGHSSGAHLALAALLSRPVEIGALLLLGGIYDLQPLWRSVHQKELQFSEAEVRLCSPLQTLAKAARENRRLALPPTLVAVGSQETSEFVRQSRALHWILQHHTDARWHAVEGAAHFDAALLFNAQHSQLRHFALHHGL